MDPQATGCHEKQPQTDEVSGPDQQIYVVRGSEYCFLNMYNETVFLRQDINSQNPASYTLWYSDVILHTNSSQEVVEPSPPPETFRNVVPLRECISKSRQTKPDHVVNEQGSVGNKSSEPHAQRYEVMAEADEVFHRMRSLSVDNRKKHKMRPQSTVDLEKRLFCSRHSAVISGTETKPQNRSDKIYSSHLSSASTRVLRRDLCNQLFKKCKACGQTRVYIGSSYGTSGLAARGGGSIS